MMRKIIISFLLILSVQAVFGQKKIVFERLRCFSSNPTVTEYLLDTSIARTILSQLNATLLKHKGLPITDTTKLKILFMNFNFIPGPIQPDFTDKDPEVLHLYIDFFEEDPFYFFRKLHQTKQKLSDSTLQDRTKSVFSITAWLVNADKKIELSENLDLVITEADNPGMGVPYGNGITFNGLSVLPKVFTALLKTATNILYDPGNKEELVEMKLQPAFLADNYILPKTLNQPRIYVTNKKDFSNYRLGGTTEMIRRSEPAYEEILIKGKKAQKYPEDLTRAIMKTPNLSQSDYVFLRQDARDVIRDKNYLVKLTVQMDPAVISLDEAHPFTNFLNGDFHYLFKDADTLAKFSIQKNTDPENQVSPSLVGNGYDTVNFHRIKINTSQSVWKMGYNYIVKGRIANKPFTIKCGPLNLTKEIFVEDKLICIAQGKFTMDKFVLFDASLSPELLNQLFIIGFNRFFE